MPLDPQHVRQCLEADGYLLLSQLYDAEWLAAARDELDRVLAEQQDESVSIRSSRGSVYAARNVHELTAIPTEAARRLAVSSLLRELLGEGCGLVRVLFFDKPPGRSWSLPWHQDRTIAVASHRESERYRKPTVKAGVPHVEAPRDVLERMLTLRIHLDAMTMNNGPLEVVPGSHRADSPDDRQPVTLTAAAGDVLAMRPLLRHRSGDVREPGAAHRRVLHLEFAAGPLDDGFQWRQFIPAGSE